VVSIYLDDCIEQRRLISQLRAAEHVLYLPSELAVEGQADGSYTETAYSGGPVPPTALPGVVIDLNALSA
jgi:hypothetical protein